MKRYLTYLLVAVVLVISIGAYLFLIGMDILIYLMSGGEWLPGPMTFSLPFVLIAGFLYLRLQLRKRLERRTQEQRQHIDPDSSLGTGPISGRRIRCR